MVFLKSCFGRPTLFIDCEESVIDYKSLKSYITRIMGLPEELYSLHHNGRLLTGNQVVDRNEVVHITIPLLGGKGGFGSMLRAIGAQIEKTTNREACRDLSGRRLRDINEEQRLKKWLAKQKEREEASARRRKERLERLCAVPKHDYQDPDYDKARSELPERIHDAITEGLQKAQKMEATLSKRKAPDVRHSSKKRRLWLGVDASCESGDSLSESDSESSGDSMRNNPPDSASQGDSMSSAYNSSVEMMEGPQTSSQSFETDSTCFSTGESNSTTSTVGKLNVRESDADAKASSSSSNAACLPETEPALEVLEQKYLEREIKISEVSAECETAEDSENLDLMKFSDPRELEELGFDKLKKCLMNLSLKCGGTIHERSQRLWAVRGLKPEEFPPSLLAKSKKSKK